jgi:predicted nucleic acid-binding protein
VTDTLVDTDILSELIRERNARVAARAKESITRGGPLAISVVTVMELAKGLEKAGRANVLDSYLARLRPLQVLKFTAEEARLAGVIYGALERTGASIGRADPMIAATALVHDLTLVTGNVDHYERIRKLGHPLRIENWRD